MWIEIVWKFAINDERYESTHIGSMIDIKQDKWKVNSSMTVKV